MIIFGEIYLIHSVSETTKERNLDYTNTAASHQAAFSSAIVIHSFETTL